MNQFLSPNRQFSVNPSVPTAGSHAIGIGAQKCASSWVHDVLAQHPDVAIPARKELDFFSYHHDRGHRWYSAQFEGPGLRFENSPSYLHDPRSPARAAAFAPDARIVVMLRDPVERAFSHHLHEIAKGHIQPQPFDQAMRDNPDYLEQGFYARHLARWFDAFPPTSILALFTEDIRANPESVVRRLWNFLGLAPTPLTRVAGERRNVSDQARSARLRTILRTGGDGLRRLGMEEPLAKFKSMAPVRSVLDWNSRDLRETVPPLSRTEKSQLARMYADDMRALADLLAADNLPWSSWSATNGGLTGTPQP